MKRRIKLTESALKNIIKESIKKTLNEYVKNGVYVNTAFPDKNFTSREELDAYVEKRGNEYLTNLKSKLILQAFKNVPDNFYEIDIFDFISDYNNNEYNYTFNYDVNINYLGEKDKNLVYKFELGFDGDVDQYSNSTYEKYGDEAGSREPWSNGWEDEEEFQIKKAKWEIYNSDVQPDTIQNETLILSFEVYVNKNFKLTNDRIVGIAIQNIQLNNKPANTYSEISRSANLERDIKNMYLNKVTRDDRMLDNFYMVKEKIKNKLQKSRQNIY